MKPEDKVISRELAEKLAEHVTVDSEKLWVRVKGRFVEWSAWEVHSYWDVKEIRKSGGLKSIETVPAPDLTELLELLPNQITAYHEEEGRDVTCEFTLKKDSVLYRNDTTGHELMSFYDDDLTQAAGELLLWCLENGHRKGEGE